MITSNIRSLEKKGRYSYPGTYSEGILLLPCGRFREVAPRDISLPYLAMAAAAEAHLGRGAAAAQVKQREGGASKIGENETIQK